MLDAPHPENETQRLQRLRELAILDTEPEALYDDVVRLASHICGTPISLVSLVDGHRQWFKAKIGLDAVETSREFAFCAHAILEEGLFEIPDSRLDPRFADNPLVTGDPSVIFYAGLPLDMGEGLPAGTLCVIDRKPRRLDENQKQALRCLANQVSSCLKLRLAHRDLEKALKARSAFFATMSHEIRTPMNGILGLTNLLLDSVEGENNRERLGLVRECCHTLLSLVNDILDFSKLESGKVEIENHAFDLLRLLRNQREILLPLAQPKGLELEWDLRLECPWVVTDSTRLTQILMNLLNNAVKFTERGRVALRVSDADAGQGRRRLVFRVEDQGIGISEENQGLLFRPFTQMEASTTRKFGGTGLGLAIVKGLVETLGGSIEVKSRPGLGSTFVLVLECAEAEASARPGADWVQHPPGSEENRKSALLGELHPLRILVAEDNRVNQLVVAAYLKKLGYAADLASNGLEVLALMETQAYDLILMDCQMPEMDGFEAAEAIRKRWPEGSRPEIYALTAGLLSEDKDRYRRLGMKRQLSKPLEPETLREALAACPRRLTRPASV